MFQGILWLKMFLQNIRVTHNVPTNVIQFDLNIFTQNKECMQSVRCPAPMFIDATKSAHAATQCVFTATVDRNSVFCH